MDLATIGGLLLAVAAFAIAEVMDGGSLRQLLSPSALVLILGGTLGATVVSYTGSDLLALPRAVLSAFRRVSTDPVALVGQVMAVADLARREGLLTLQDEAEKVSHPLLRRGLMLVADGIDPAEVEASLTTEAELVQQATAGSAAVMETAGGFAPTMGIIGTVVGLVRVLSNMQDQARLASDIAVAFLATLYGIGTANLFWLPLAAKLRRNAQLEAHTAEMVIGGLQAVQSGAMPRMVEEMMTVYLSTQEQTRLKAVKAEGKSA